jgi:hypothetical protein
MPNQHYVPLEKPQISIQDTDGTEVVSAPKNEPYQVDSCLIENSDGSYSETEKYSDPFEHTVPDIEVTDTTSATSLGTFPGGVDINVVCPAGGCDNIIPAYVRPSLPIAGSAFVTNDLVDQYANGVFDRLDTERSGIVRMLGADQYTLHSDTTNVFDTTARYTFDDGTNAWTGSAFSTSYGAATDYVIIDHLSYLVLYVANLGNVDWPDAVADCASHSAGGYDWRLGAEEEYKMFIPRVDEQYYQTSKNPFRRGVVSSFSDFYMWTSRTYEPSSSNGIQVRASGIVASTSKTSTSLVSCYPIANYEPTT